MPEIEFSILWRESIDSRIADRIIMTKEINVWAAQRNKKQGEMKSKIVREEVKYFELEAENNAIKPRIFF